MVQSYQGLNADELTKLLKEKDQQLASKGNAPVRLSCKKAQTEFLNQKPSAELKLSKFPVTVDALREALSQKDNAGDNKLEKDTFIAVMKQCKVPGPQAKDLIEGFFLIGDPKKSGKTDYTVFLAELTRMHTFLVLRVAQYRINQKDAVKKEFAPANKVAVEELKQLLSDTGIGAKAVTEQVDDCLSNQVGKNLTLVTLKGLVKWYFNKYYPTEDPATRPPPVLSLEESNTKRFAKYKNLMEGVLKEVDAQLKKKECKDKTTEEFKDLTFLGGKLMGLMEVMEDDLEKIFVSSAEQAQIQASVEKCLAVGVKFG